MDNQSINQDSFDEGVVKGCYEPIEIRFQTLINSKCEAPFDWYKSLGLDKSNASRIRRGLIIPPQWLRIKIAHYFETDSSTIWKIQDMPHIKQLLKKQKRSLGVKSPSPNNKKIKGEEDEK